LINTIILHLFIYYYKKINYFYFILIILFNNRRRKGLNEDVSIVKFFDDPNIIEILKNRDDYKIYLWNNIELASKYFKLNCS
jgi:hypothetical protein